MIAARYFDLIREMKHNTYNHRLRLVESAHQRGINRAPVLHNRAHGPEVARSLPAAGTIGLGRALVGAKPPASPDAVGRRGPNDRAPQDPSHFRRTPPPIREFDRPIGHELKPKNRARGLG